MKKPSALIITIISVFLGITASSSIARADETLDRIYYYLAKTQSAQGPIGVDFFLTAEQAFCAIAFINRGHINRAKNVLNFYDDIYRVDRSSGGFKGFALQYDRHGVAIDRRIDYLAQSAVLLAIVHYTEKTRDRRFVRIADELAELFKTKINRWGAFFHEDMKMYARENLLAYSVFRAISGLKEDVEYARIAKRLKYVLNDLFYDKSKKQIENSVNENLFLPSEQILGKLIFSPDITLSTESLKTLDWIAMRNLADAVHKNDVIAGELEKYLKLPFDVPDGAYISDADGNPALLPTGMYIFMKERFNPFAIAQEISEKRIALVSAPKGELFKGDNFEDDVIHFYEKQKNIAVNADLLVSYDTEVKKSGAKSLRVQFTPLKNEKSAAALSRVFYPSQNFTNYGRVKFWLRARPAVPGTLSVKIKLRIIDENGNVGETNPLNYSARGVENTVICPGAFTAVGKNQVDAEKVRSLSFVFEEVSQTSWNIQIDDIRME